MKKNGILRVSYYQEIMPVERSNADFTIDIDAATERSDGIPPGDYLAGPLQGTFALDVPSFDRWRRMLCRAALNFDAESVWSSPDAFTGEPFYELIQCERKSVFGPLTSFKLAEDFRKWEEIVEQNVCSQVEVKDLQFFMDYYQLFKKAFSVSANSGCTIFQSENEPQKR
jgi:hypothetical protein